MNSEEWQKIKEIFNAAFDLSEDERRVFLEKYDETLRLEVEKLFKADREATGFIAEPAVIEVGLAEPVGTDDFIGKQIDSYKILREIGQGGMGTVYLASRADGEFDQKVALKLIKRGMDTNAVLKRFMIERQILARLKHPFIAGLLDGGTTPDGLPYFVMEYVEGVPITGYCESGDLTLKDRLNLFQSICSATSYAHQNLIIHRDIKPSNILVTADGIPKLLDFGIAKLLNPEWSAGTIEDTATMFRMFTPEYASPEQIRGLPITTTSDVYSLGVVLYELLSGQRPYRVESLSREDFINAILTEEPLKPSSAVNRHPLAGKDTKPIEQIVTANQNSKQSAGQFPKPKTRNPKLLRGDLDNIILKALRKEPERRYASVQEFSDDIRRHLDGLPVRATADTVSYRLKKFIKRHRAGVLAGSLIIVTLTLATAITTWQAVVARRERDKAELRFNQVRKLAHTVLFDYSDGLDKLAGTTPIRQKMVNDALEYLDNLSSESGNSFDLRSEMAAAYQKVGDVQGSPAKANLGNYAGALESYKKAVTIREKLLGEAPGNDQIKHELTRSYQMAGHVSHLTGNIPAALEYYRQAFALFDSMPAKNLEEQRDMSALYERNGGALKDSGNLPEAIDNYKKAIAGTTELVGNYPDDNEIKRDLALADILLGDAVVESGDLKGALEIEKTAKALLVPLVTATNAQSQRDEGIADERIATILLKMGENQPALDIELGRLKVDQELFKADPQNATARQDVYIDYNKISKIQLALGDFKNAMDSQNKSLELCEIEVKSNPASSEARSHLAGGYFQLGAIFETSGKLPEALANYKKTVELEEAEAGDDPTNDTARGNLAEDYTKVSDLALKLGDRKSALDGYLKALAIFEDLAASNPDELDNKTSLAEVYEDLGNYYVLLAKEDKKSENWQEAANRYQQSLDILQELKDAGKLDPESAGKPDALKQNLEVCRKALAKHLSKNFQI